MARRRFALQRSTVLAAACLFGLNPQPVAATAQSSAASHSTLRLTCPAIVACHGISNHEQLVDFGLTRTAESR